MDYSGLPKPIIDRLFTDMIKHKLADLENRYKK